MIDPVPETDGHVSVAGPAGTAPEALSNSNSDFATKARGHPSIDDPQTRQADTAYLDVTNNPGPTRTACHRGWSCRHERPPGPFGTPSRTVRILAHGVPGYPPHA